MKKFRLLKPDEIEVRVARIKENGIEVLLYKTARTDANLLDETVGCENWENDFKLVDGVLYGGIGVNYGKGLVWKWDAGVESNTEAEKGRASDAFKRAGFKHGIGRELYSSPFVWIPSDKCTITNRGEKLYCNDSFVVRSIEYDVDENIKALTIVNERTGTCVFSYGNGNYTPKQPKAERNDSQPSDKEIVFDCAECHTPIDDRVHDYSVKIWKKPLCRNCQKKIPKPA